MRTVRKTRNHSHLPIPSNPTGGRTGGNRVQNDADSVRDGAVKTARSGVRATTVSARNARELQRTEVHAKEKAATGFEPVNDGFANRSLRPLGYAAQEAGSVIRPSHGRPELPGKIELSQLPAIKATPFLAEPASGRILLADRPRAITWPLFRHRPRLA